MNTPEVVLIHPGNSKRLYQSLANSLTAVEPPVWATLLASYLLRQGRHVSIIDAEALELNAEQVARQVKARQPKLTVVVVYGHQPSASTQMMEESSRIVNAIKQEDSRLQVMMVGGHVAALPGLTLEQEPCDYVATGEGFVTLSELLQALDSSNPRLDLVRGLGFRRGDQVVFNPPAPLCQDLDRAVSRQAWQLLDMSRYRAHNWHCFGEPNRQPYASVYTTLGCPFTCSFCCIQAPFRSGAETDRSYRRWSPELVVDQLEFLTHQYGIRHVKFADEMFVLNPRHVEGICREIIRRKLSLNIWAYARVDTVKDNLVPLLREAGFSWLALGIESGNSKVRRNAGKGVAQDEVFATVGKLRDGGVNVIGNFIFGLPGDDLESMQETLDLALELRCDFANFYCTMAYPGSSLYDKAVGEGLPLPRTWSGYSQHAVDALPLPTEHLTGAQVLAFRDRAFHRYYEDQGYLAFMEQKFGAAVRHDIEKMATVKLERRRP